MGWMRGRGKLLSWSKFPKKKSKMTIKHGLCNSAYQTWTNYIAFYKVFLPTLTIDV
jgi:hypothetical protein